MNRRLAFILRPIILPLSGLVLLAGLFAAGWWSGQSPAEAAAPPAGSAPTVTSVNVSTFATSARIDFSTDLPAESRIEYGTTTSYGSFEPAGGGYYSPGQDKTSHSITLNNLSSGTTYHFRIHTRIPGGGGNRTTPDRAFTTSSGAAGNSQLAITPLGVQCQGGKCQVSFSTNLSANVQVRWDVSNKGTFDSYTLGSNGEPVGQYATVARSIDVPATGSLDTQSTYHYRLRATDQAGGVTVTDDLTFDTAKSPEDRTFSTGACNDGTPIGSCSPSGAICETGGSLVFRCDAQCGFTCPGGQTCGSNGQCLADPPLTGSPYQCNPASCYAANGALLSPTPAGSVCYASWSRCTANTVLKVRKDRGCNLWLSCATSLQGVSLDGQTPENLCLSLSACNSLGPNGQCNSYLPPGQCDNDPLRFCASSVDCTGGGTCNLSGDNNALTNQRDVEYSTPLQVSQIANLSGNVVAGLNWDDQPGIPSIRGLLPWQLMRQVGGDAKIRNGDFEYNPPSVGLWEAVPFGQPKSATLKVQFESQSASTNHVLYVSPVDTIPNLCSNDASKSCTDDSQCSCGIPVEFSGAATQEFPTNPEEYYVAVARVRSNSDVTVRLQFGDNNYSNFTVADGPDADSLPDPAYADVKLTSAWQRVTIGPIKGLSGYTRFAIVLAPGQPAVPFYVDDVQVQPVLQTDTSPSYVSPSCRLYPREDAPACDYIDQSGVEYHGWQGYCLEQDSLTGTCLSWWPVDLIKGQSSIFGSETQAGYQDRVPLYLCASAKGNNKGGPIFVRTFVCNIRAIPNRNHPM